MARRQTTRTKEKVITKVRVRAISPIYECRDGEVFAVLVGVRGWAYAAATHKDDPKHILITVVWDYAFKMPTNGTQVATSYIVRNFDNDVRPSWIEAEKAMEETQ